MASDLPGRAVLGMLGSNASGCRVATEQKPVTVLMAPSRLLYLGGAQDLASPRIRSVRDCRCSRRLSSI